MGFNDKIPHISTCIFAVFALCMSSTISATDTTAFENSLSSFSGNIFREINQSNAKKSIIFSPFSIQSCLAMVRMGAEGQTADEMDSGLRLTGQSIQTVADNYHSMLAKYEDSKILKIANKVYVAQHNELSDEYRDVLSNKFFSSAENIDFAQTENAANTINTWVAEKTDNGIKDLVSSDSLNADTDMLLLSAIHFEGKWASAFPKENTREMNFKIDDKNTVPVQMMALNSTFGFGMMPEYQARILQLPYKDSDLSMVILLPFKDLALLEQKLKNVDIQKLMKASLVKTIKLEVFLPKFKAEFQIELNDILKKMGMTEMFSHADFGKMLKSPKPMAVSSVIHKAFIEVTEEGTKAAAATASLYETRLGNPYIDFYMDQPFYYAIVNEDFVPFFQGTFTGV